MNSEECAYAIKGERERTNTRQEMGVYIDIWPSVVVCTKFETKEYPQVDSHCCCCCCWWGWWSQSSVILILITTMNGTIVYSCCPLVGRHLLFNFPLSVDWFSSHCLLILIFTARTDTCCEWQKNDDKISTDRLIIISY